MVWLFLLFSRFILTNSLRARGFPSFLYTSDDWTQREWNWPSHIVNPACANVWQSVATKNTLRWICFGGIDQNTSILSREIYAMTFWLDENAHGLDNP